MTHPPSPSQPDPRSPEIELTEDEIESLVYEAGPDADHDRIVFAVERIIATRLEVLAAEIESNVDWSEGRWGYGDNEGYQHAARIVRGGA